jgi:hypothetical protein
MPFHKKQIAQLIFAFLTAMVILFSAAIPASADGIITDGKINSNEKIENDVIVFGDIVTIDGTVDGDLIALGGEIQINGDISGSLIAIGRDIEIEGQVGGSTYSAGVSLNLGPSSAIERSVYFVGIRLSTEDGMNIGRDLVVAALTGQLAGQVGRDFKATIGLLQFIDIIREGVEEDITPAPSTQPESEGSDETGAARLNSGNYQFTSLGFEKQSSPDYSINDIQLRSLNTNSIQQLEPANIQNEVLLKWIVDRLEAFITYFLVGLIAIWILPGRFTEWVETIPTKPLTVIGYGLIGLIIALNGFLVVLIIAAILLAVGLGLGYITLWQLAFYFWGLTYSSLVFITFLFSLFVFYVSKTIAAYLLGVLIIGRFTSEPGKHKVLVLALGLLIFILLAAIPYFGWAVGITAMILGLGAVLLRMRQIQFSAKNS